MALTAHRVQVAGTELDLNDSRTLRLSNRSQEVQKGWLMVSDGVAKITINNSNSGRGAKCEKCTARATTGNTLERHRKRTRQARERDEKYFGSRGNYSK
jgi:hypothetical protein